MKLLDLIFELVRIHVPIKEEDWARMKSEAEKDTAEWLPEDENQLKGMYAKYNRKWWFNLAVAVSFIPLNRKIAEYMDPSNHKSDTDESLM